MSGFLKKQKFKSENVRILPISAVAGENLFEKSSKMPWYKGSTLV